MAKFKTLQEAFADTQFNTAIDELDLSFAYQLLRTEAREDLYKLLQEEGIDPFTNMAEIEESQFINCLGIQSVVISEGVDSIKDYAFSDCAGIYTLKFLGDTHRSIGFSAFDGCENVEEIEIDNASLDTFAFANCRKLKKAIIGKNVDLFGSFIFDNCPDLKIYCYQDSSADSYAEEYHYRVNYLD